MEGALHQVIRRRLVAKCEIECLEDLHVGSAESEQQISAYDLPQIKYLDGTPIIPGSSIKGVLRAHLTRLLNSVDQIGDASLKSRVLKDCPVTNDETTEREFVKASSAEKLNGFDKMGVIPRLFGASGFASPLRITDARMLNGCMTRPRKHVSIDLGTDRTKNSALIDLEVVGAGARFEFRLIFDELADKRMDVPNTIMCLLLRSLAGPDGMEMFLGGWKSRGYGLCRVKLVQLDSYDLKQLVLEEKPSSYTGDALLQFLNSSLRDVIMGVS